MKFKEGLRYVLSIPKTIIFNMNYFSFKNAIKFPIIVSYDTRLNGLNGKVILNEIKTGIVKIGFGKVGIFDRKHSYSIWDVSGKIIFTGKANIGHGSKITVAPSGVLKIGNDFRISAESAIHCSKYIEFGNNNLLSWEILVLDTDFHIIKNREGKIVNPDKAILLGDNNWIGCKSTILKGTTLGDGNVVAANTVLSSENMFNNKVISNEGKIIKSNITWDY